LSGCLVPRVQFASEWHIIQRHLQQALGAFSLEITDSPIAEHRLARRVDESLAEIERHRRITAYCAFERLDLPPQKHGILGEGFPGAVQGKAFLARDLHRHEHLPAMRFASGIRKLPESN